jgi:hypothetical protein
MVYSEQDGILFQWLEDKLNAPVFRESHYIISDIGENEIRAVAAFRNYTPKGSVELLLGAEVLTRKFIKKLMHYCFVELEIYRVTAFVLTLAPFKFHERILQIGFVKEARLFDFYGVGKDVFCYRLTEKDLENSKFSKRLLKIKD